MIIGYTVLETWCMMDVIIFHFGLFFALLPPNSLKNENLKYEKRKSQKNEKKKLATSSSFYTSVPKIMIICHTVPEIWHMTHVIFIFHFGLFFAFYPPNSLKNQNFRKMKKILGDIIILHKCTTNQD